jgi:dUTP pyrophosphatase
MMRLAPTEGSVKAAWYDLRSAHDAVVPARGKILIFTDLQIQIPEGYYGQIASPSGLAFWEQTAAEKGIID